MKMKKQSIWMTIADMDMKITHIQTQYVLMMFYVMSKKLMKAYIFLYALMQTVIL
ncbi:Hypothetical protein EUBELI_20376 (plasmid) [Lachnospira eligens ATCC 27750]|uniref:Uncharacterized protein n=1 Tax=Lachnospira eligens (strain ATCC 27750 / DSM 3376 / VPI C15-48 / C15-B4) TaxID=515620 RepID=C4Z6C9_LACE2|nr:Hypothetical protein EUBELI_20376 [[Eubacterium] eligens ATCC 27750]